MNNNDFENNRQNEQYEIYSKRYIPGENGYTEQKKAYQYTYTMPLYEPEKKRGGVARKIFLILISALCTVVFCAGLVFCTARFVTIRYEYLNSEKVSGDTVINDTEIPEVTDASDGEDDKDWFFGIGENYDMTVSDKAEKDDVSGNVGDDDLSMADVVELVSDSVVEITTSETLRNGLVYSSGAGSGVIVTENGMIVTNNHVVEGATQINVRLSNGNVYEADLVARDAETDLAVVKIEPKEKLTLATMGNSDTLRVGEEVLAIGNPLGLLGGTVTNGIISALEREVTIEGETMTLLQHNAAVSPGNSGGALFNMRGELIGIVNAKYSSNGAEGLGFAIPVNTVTEIYSDLVNYGYVKGRADHGLSIIQQYTLRPGYYGYVLYIVESKYTDKLVYGDRLISIGGVAPSTVNEAYSLLGEYEIGDKVEIVVYRSGVEIPVELTICEYHP